MHVLEGAVIGRESNVGDHCYVEGGVHIGDGVVIKNGVCLWTGITIEDRVFVGPGVTFTNDLRPRARVYHDDYERTRVREGASIGANATILPGITIGRFSMIGAGSVVTHDVPDFALVCGNPARRRGWVCECGRRLHFEGVKEASTTCLCGLVFQMQDGAPLRRRLD